MATYTESLNATDSYTINPATQQVTRAATLSPLTNFDFYTNSPYASWAASSYSRLCFVFPERSSTYLKKRQTNKQLYAYVTAKSSSFQAPEMVLPSGSVPVYFLANWDSPHFGMSYNPTAGNFSGISANAYLDVTALGNDFAAHCSASGLVYSDRHVVASAGLTVQSHTGANKPYVTYSYEDVVPYVKNAYPQSGFVNEKQDITFGWTFAYDVTGVGAAIKQGSAKFRWRPQGTTPYTEISVSGEQNTYTVAADTFTTDGIEWQVVVTSDDGIAGTASPWYTLSTVDVQSAPSVVSPVSVFCAGDKPNTFTWNHNISTGSPQYAYELQYSTDSGGSWETLKAKTTSAVESAVISANTLPAGTLLWRVRTYNSDDVAGSWSGAATIVVQAAPLAPSISSVTTAPRPVIAWQATDQQAYQIQAGDYDSGTVYGTAKIHTIPAYLPDGLTTIKLRVQNAFGLWSPWSEVDTTITHAGVVAVALNVTHVNSEVYLSWTGAHGVYYVYRDDVLIAKTTDREYVDRITLGTHDYTVRGATSDAYDLSGTVSVTAVCETAMMADIDNIEWVYLSCRRAAKPSTSASIVQQVVYQHYDGRSLPVADIAEYVDEAYTFNYSLLSDEAQARALLGKVVIFKTPRNECIIGVLESMPYERDRWSTDFTFTIRAIDYQLGVTYDV